METIKNYLDSIFIGLPESEEIMRLKSDLQDSMEDKYLELKREGKTENEAIGIVISEFGNIDELLNEMEVQTKMNQSQLPTLDLEQAKEYLSLKHKSDKMVGLGVWMIIFSTSILAFVYQALEDNLFLTQLSGNAKNTFPALIFLAFLIPAVAILIYSGTKLDSYKFIEENKFRTTLATRAYVENYYNQEKTKQTQGVIIGVSVCFLSLVPALISNMISDEATTYGGSILLFMISIAVYILITTGSKANVCKQLLQIDEYKVEKSKESKVIGIVASIIWPIAVCIFLFTGLVYHKWEINWIVFPLTGILFGGFCAVYSMSTKEN